ncbi:uncharacterized protein C7orf50 homolog [Cephus cinctus]|uniref:Uncharacterized protein C7orf50 homolog n=1 Tax=Cephus cinctus TaxID=211228 RepID=A0AAJ7FJY9_CEPCN|nr:uncharacterized protein C7orf50 homolog [Cephus cinctus]
MGSESGTVNFEVKKAKARKRTKKKIKIEEDSALGVNSNGAETADKSGHEFKIVKVEQVKSEEISSVSPSNGVSNQYTEFKDDRRTTGNGKRKQKNDQNSIENVNNGSLMKKIKGSGNLVNEIKEEIDRNDEEVMEGDKKNAKKPSKRQVKREKAEQKEMDKREASRLEVMQKALSYVSKWKHAKSEWKFEKIRQIWLIDHLLDKNLIPDAIFPTVLEYFEGCKGMARELLLKKGMDVIKKLEDEEDDETKDSIMESVEYKRARQLLQALPTET